MHWKKYLDAISVNWVEMSTSVVIYQLKVTLRGTSIWRRIRIPEHFKFAQLHEAICQSFNWQCVSHHRFKIELGEISDEHTIVEIFDEIYDKGEYLIYNSVGRWRHDVRFEKRIQYLSENINQTHAICSSGRWARPPERCGGLKRFNLIRRILADPSDSLYEPILFYISRLSAADAEWTKMDDNKIGPITLSV